MNNLPIIDFRGVSVFFPSFLFSLFLFSFLSVFCGQTLGTMSDFKCGEGNRKNRKIL